MKRKKTKLPSKKKCETVTSSSSSFQNQPNITYIATDHNKLQQYRGIINILSRRATGFQKWAKLYDLTFFMIKKTSPKMV